MNMLVQHLKAYKDSTSKEIEYLRSKIAALKQQHELVEEEVAEREEEILEHDQVIRNLESVNSRRYRAEERNDWQTLVESLNEDREYLSKDLVEIQAATDTFSQQVRPRLCACASTCRCICVCAWATHPRLHSCWRRQNTHCSLAHSLAPRVRGRN